MEVGIKEDEWLSMREHELKRQIWQLGQEVFSHPGHKSLWASNISLGVEWESQEQTPIENAEIETLEVRSQIKGCTSIATHEDVSYCLKKMIQESNTLSSCAWYLPIPVHKERKYRG